MSAFAKTHGRFNTCIHFLIQSPNRVVGWFLDPVPEPRSWMNNWSNQKKIRILHALDWSVALQDRAVARKLRKHSKAMLFWCFRGVKIELFARNTRNRSKMSEVKVGPTQIDHGGSNGSIKSGIRPYCDGRPPWFYCFSQIATLWTFLTCRLRDFELSETT